MIIIKILDIVIPPIASIQLSIAGIVGYVVVCHSSRVAAQLCHRLEINCNADATLEICEMRNV